jgi:DNA-binding transcriptional LysR family regulator
MDIQFFHTFLTVAKLGNMTQAAEQLNFSQPTITGQIRALEQHFGVLLFDRVGKKLHITDAGRTLAAYAEQLLKSYGEAHEALSAYPGNVSIGVASAMVNHFLPPLLREFSAQVPNSTVTVELCPHTPDVVKGILENRFDLGFVQNQAASDSLSQFEVLQDQLVWVVHAKTRAKYNGSAAIADYPLIAYKSGGLFRSLYEKALGKNLRPAIVYSDSEAAKNAILQGLGCGALPLIMARPLLADGTLSEFAAMPRLGFSIWFIHHRDKTLSRPARSFLDIVRARSPLG